MRYLSLLALLFAVGPAHAQLGDCRPVAGLALCGDWTDFADHAELTGDAVLSAGGLDLELPAAALVVTFDPPAVTGEVDFALPQLGPLSDWGVDGDLPRARLSLGLGAGLDHVSIGGTELPLHDNHPYLVYEIEGGLDLSFGAASISAAAGPTAKVIIDPLDPLIYLEGDAVAALTGGLVSDGAVGVSLGGALPYTSDLELKRRRWAHQSLSGHIYAQGNCQLGSYPVYVSSTVVINADANNDDAWFFESGESATDFQLGVNGAVAVGWDRGPVSLTLPVATGSLVYEAHHGKLMLHGQLESMNPFEGTVLEPLIPEATGGSLWGTYNSPSNFVLHAELESSLLGFPTSDLQLTLRDDRIDVRAELEPAYGALFGDQSVDVSGTIDTQGQFVLTGHATLNLGGLQMADATVTWTNDGLTAAGVVDVPMLGGAHVTGSIGMDGTFAFTGDAGFAPLGIALSNSSVTVSNSGARVSGDIRIPGLSSIRVSGNVKNDGTFKLVGDANITVKGFDLAGAHVVVRQSGVAISGHIDVILAEGQISGRYDTAASLAARYGVSEATVINYATLFAAMGMLSPYGKPGLTMEADMAIEIPGTGITLTQGHVKLTDSGAKANGRLRYFGNGITVKGSVSSGGNIELVGKVSYSIKVLGTGVQGDLEVKAKDEGLSGKVSGKACVNVVFDKVCKSASATVKSNGKAKLNMPSPVPDITIDVDDIF